MQKYRIVPQQDNMFWQLVQGMTLDDEEKTLLKNAVIRHVEVSVKNSAWEIALTSQTLIPDALLKAAAAQICSKCNLQDVIFYQDVIDIEDGIHKVWAKLVTQVAEGNPTVFQLLKRSKYTVDGSKLILHVPGELGGEIMRAHAVTQLMSRAIKDMLGYRCPVVCEASEEVLQNLEVDDSFNTPEYQAAVHKERVAESRAESAKAADKKPAAEKAAPRKREDLSRPVVVQSAGNTIFGTGVMGERKLIDELDGETKNVILEGFIGEGAGSGLKTIEFKTGTKLLTFCLSDESNGIACKKFFKTGKGRNGKEENYDEIMSQLKDGMSVRVRGSVRFDTYMNEYVLFVDSLAKKEQKKRTDEAEVKRVELHAHTTMSAMDAVVSVKDLIKTADSWGWPAIAITDHGVVQAYPDAAKTAEKLNIKVIYGMEGYLTGDDFEQKRANHIIFLAKNPNGLRNLYQLVSLSHVKYFHRQPRLPKKIIQEYRDGIIIGSACEAGELIRAFVEGQS
ncbi:MAG: PHP domain-containing protein, partial [Selenomonas sp.]|nr:PHP domain-containing protein [Selenomonas sp.]